MSLGARKCQLLTMLGESSSLADKLLQLQTGLFSRSALQICLLLRHQAPTSFLRLHCFLEEFLRIPDILLRISRTAPRGEVACESQSLRTWPVGR